VYEIGLDGPVCSTKAVEEAGGVSKAAGTALNRRLEKLEGDAQKWDSALLSGKIPTAHKAVHLREMHLAAQPRVLALGVLPLT
jgi:hypothetical protein